MSRLHNKAYVTSYYEGAYASRRSRAGKLTKAWHVYVPQVVDISGVVTWHFAAPSVVQAWRLAAEAVENKVRRRAASWQRPVRRVGGTTNTTKEKQ